MESMTDKENISNNTCVTTPDKNQSVEEILINNTWATTPSKNQSFEEILIAAVQELPQIWNYKDVPTAKHGPSIRNKLWQEIMNIVNSDPKHRMY